MHNNPLPVLRLDACSWELMLPANVLPYGIVNITVNSDGVYIENQWGYWDLIPYDAIIDIMEPQPVVQPACRNTLIEAAP